MKLKLEAYAALCSLAVFEINGIEADTDDFGDNEDRSPDTAEDYCCGDMQFEAKPPTQEVLNKYSITADEYQEICEKIGEAISFGSCGWCS